jgi:hypothetical protein
MVFMSEHEGPDPSEEAEIVDPNQQQQQLFDEPLADQSQHQQLQENLGYAQPMRLLGDDKGPDPRGVSAFDQISQYGDDDDMEIDRQAGQQQPSSYGWDEEL